MEEWLKKAAQFLVDNYGLDSTFADRVALFLAYLYQYGLNPRITSGWRDPEHQRELQERWDRGDRAGLRARPATDSAHTHTGAFGGRAAKAVDIVTSDDSRAAAIARALNLGSGLFFSHPDPGHYYELA